MQFMENLDTFDENDPLFRAMVRDAGGKNPGEVARRIEELNAQADKAKFLEAPTVVIDRRHEPTEHDSRDSHEPIPNIGPYCLIRQIGRGGFGRVFEGFHRDRPDRTVAVKVYENRWLDDIERLEIEKLVVQKLKHPNLVTAIDSGESLDGTPYLVMILVDGIRIDEFIQQKRLGFNQIARMFGQIAEAMDYAHAQDVVHRDLKPGNILITADGVPVAMAACRRNCDKLASIHLELGDIDQAEKWLDIAFRETAEFLKRPDLDPGELHDWSGCLALAYQLAIRKNDHEKADDYARQWREFVEECIDKHPDYEVFRDALSQSTKLFGSKNVTDLEQR